MSGNASHRESVLIVDFAPHDPPEIGSVLGGGNAVSLRDVGIEARVFHPQRLQDFHGNELVEPDTRHSPHQFAQHYESQVAVSHFLSGHLFRGETQGADGFDDLLPPKALLVELQVGR